MFYPPYCIFCGSKANWNCDYSCEDYGFELEGLIGVYCCSNCNTDYSIIDIYIDNSEKRVIKYNTYDSDYEIFEEEIDNRCATNCLYCKCSLNVISSNEICVDDIFIPNGSKENCISTKLQCSNCNCNYEIIDNMDFCSNFESRSIFID